MKKPKKSIGLRISEQLHEQLKEEAENTGVSVNGIIETAIIKYLAKGTEEERLANLIIEKYDKKYANALTRIRLAANTADRNVQALLHIKNTELFAKQTNPENFISTSELKHEIIEKAQKEVKEQIAIYKQRKDNKKTEDES